ncbi:hypothetical protein N2152v2_010531 [Parachlorella kessleri]
MTAPLSPAAVPSALGSEGFLDLLGSLQFDDPILSSLLFPARNQGDQPGTTNLEDASGQLPDIANLDSSAVPQEGPLTAPSPLHVKSNSVSVGPLPATPLGGSPFDQQTAPAGQAADSHAAARDPCLLPPVNSSQPLGDFLLDAAALAAPLERDASALLQGILAPDFSRQFEAAAAATAKGAGTPLDEAPEAFLQQLLGSGSFLFPGEVPASGKPRDTLSRDMAGLAPAPGKGTSLAIDADVATMAPALPIKAAAGPSAPGAGLEFLTGDLQLGSSSLPPLPGPFPGSLQLSELFEQLGSRAFPELSAATLSESGPAPTCGSLAAPPRAVEATSRPAALVEAAGAAGPPAVADVAPGWTAQHHLADTAASPAISLLTAAPAEAPPPWVLPGAPYGAPAVAQQAAGEGSFFFPPFYTLPPGAEGEALHFPQLAPDGSLPPGEWPVESSDASASARGPLSQQAGSQGASTEIQQPPAGPLQQSAGPHQLPQQPHWQQHQQVEGGGLQQRPADSTQLLLRQLQQQQQQWQQQQQQQLPPQQAQEEEHKGGVPMQLHPYPEAAPGRWVSTSLQGVGASGEDEGLTDKQIRARRAQKRFREKQKAKRHGLEEGLDLTAAEIEREHALRGRAEKEYGAMEQLLGYKEGMLATLQAAARGEEVPSAEPVLPVQRAHEEQGFDAVFPVEEVQRYRVEGDTARRDLQGRATQAPAFEKVAANYTHIVGQLKLMLEEARRSGEAVLRRAGAARLAQLGAEQSRQSRALAAPGQGGSPAAEAQQGQQGQPRVSWDSILAYARECSLPRRLGVTQSPSQSHPVSLHSPPGQLSAHASELLGEEEAADVLEVVADAAASLPPFHTAALQGEAPGAGAQPWESAGTATSAWESPDTVAPAPTGPAGHGMAQSAGSHSAVGGGVGPFTAGAARLLASLGIRQQETGASPEVQPEVALRVASATLAATGTLREGSALSMDARERIYLETLLKRMLVSATMRGARPWTLAEGGLLAQESDGPYFFTGADIRRVTRLLRQAGTLLWQQALLFPDNLLKLSAVRIDTGQPIFETDQAHSTAQWEQLVEHLDLLPSQLADVVAMHAEFMAAVLPARRRRRELLENLMQVQLKGLVLGVGSAQEQAYASLASMEINNQIQKTTQDELAAYVTFAAGMFRIMLFPLQKVKLFLYSWPYFPQMHLIALAVRKKLGMEPLAIE